MLWPILYTQQTFVLMKMSRRRLEDVFYLRLQKTSYRRLQDVLIKTNMFALTFRLQKTSWSRPIHLPWLYVFKTSSRRFVKTFSRHLQDVFKTYHQVKLFLLTRLWEAFNTFLRRSFPRWLSIEEYAQVTLLLINLWSVYKICKGNKNFSSFSFSVYYTFSGCI